METIDRFNAKIDRSGDCWLWTGERDERSGRFQKARAHCWAYEHFIGPIPDGMTLDHLCGVRHCVNPAHLEPVSFSGRCKKCGQALAFNSEHREGCDLANDVDRFWSHVIRADIGCWEWTIYRDAGGYGRFKWKGVPSNAHRISYELLVGPIPEGLFLDHLCCNAGCVRPDHLEPVTCAENNRRRWAGVGETP